MSAAKYRIVGRMEGLWPHQLGKFEMHRLMPFASTALGAEQPLLNSELLGYSRDPLAPVQDAVTANARRG